MSLPELSIKRPVLATVMTIALVLLGIVSLLNLASFSTKYTINSSRPQLSLDGLVC